ncbi:hypothetical protein DSM112329_00496 [Paraconexibacter sp. AEG42_29]|uniref:Uncharacterized protein n=1 Tax=Paraconexibacter sp. AEG42_29 TaxID=2997339 RepID=A0AAU7APX5_9ACTN
MGTDTPTPQQDKQITVDVPADRLPEFYAFFARFLAADGSGGRRGRRGPGGPRGRHGRGPGHGPDGHHRGCRPSHTDERAAAPHESADITPPDTGRSPDPA